MIKLTTIFPLTRRSLILTYFLLCLGSILAAVSVAQGILNSQTYSQDFQWSPSVLLSEGINPYDYYLKGNEGGRIILSQAPNYLHALYILLQPVAMLDWASAKIAWVILNMIFATLSLYMIIKASRLGRKSALFLIIVFLCSTPFRNSLGNGQQSFIALMAFSLLLLKNSFSSGLAGLAYLKYSFAPPLAAYIFARRGVRQFFISITIAAIGLLIFFWMQKSDDFLTVTLEPLLVSKQAVGLGTADLMSLTELFLPRERKILWVCFYYLLPVILSFLIAVYCAKRIGDPLLELAAICVTALASFKHLGYDYVALLPAFAVAMRNPTSYPSIIIMAGVSYFWFGLKLINSISPLPQTGSTYTGMLLALNFMIAVSILSALISSTKKESDHQLA